MVQKSNVELALSTLESLALSRMRDAQSNPVISRFSRFVFGALRLPFP